MTFTNKDPLKHHVYSFSKAKKFEIKLYSGKPPEPIVFNKIGSVTLGCNIHDHMLAYAYIVDTPYYSLSNKKGYVQLSGLPDGKYQLNIWHPLQKNPVVNTIIEVKGTHQSLSYQVSVKPVWRKFRNPNQEPVDYDQKSVFD